MATPADWLRRERCSIYTFDVHAATNHSLPPRYVPKRWRENKFSAELWLQDAVKRHPWRTSDPASADVVLLKANFSMYCRAQKHYSSRHVWRALLPLLGYTGRPTANLLHPPARELIGTERTPKVLVLTDNECSQPWMHTWLPSEVLMLSDQANYEHLEGQHVRVVPFVIAGPQWLVAGRGRGGVGDAVGPPWSARRLVFFTGHVPKLYIRPTRYLVWKQIRRHPGVTALSATINCTIGQFAECSKKQTAASLQTYCHPYCASHVEDDNRVALRDAPGKKTVAMGKCAPGWKSFNRWCSAYQHVPFAEELGDIASATRNLGAREYFAEAMSHRFCLNAPGDFVSTPKIAEFVALGAAGGCLPVMVVPRHPGTMLPYSRWLDWCEAAILVSERTARGDMAKVLRRLEQMSEAEAAAMRSRLSSARDAFTWRRAAADPMSDPSAADYVLAEACTLARAQRVGRRRQTTRFAANGTGAASTRPRPPPLQRCIL